MQTDLSHLGDRLLFLRTKAAAFRAAVNGDRRPIEVDQSLVGRVCRMERVRVAPDADAVEARRALDLERIDAALTRMEAGDYGYCADCGREIELARLEADPAATRCTKCAK